MLATIMGFLEIVRISGWAGLRDLLGHSRSLKQYGGKFAVMHCLIALEKSDLNRTLLSDSGLTVSAQEQLDPSTLCTVCEYLYENNLLTRTPNGAYKAKSAKRFRSLLQAMYACYAYGDPVYVLDKLLAREFQYGRDTVRNDKYDAIASAALTSIFSFGFSQSILKKVHAKSLLDLGCGTGEYLNFLERNGFPGALYGLDLSEEAISEGKERGFESARVKLFVGDVLNLEKSAAVIDRGSMDIISFMFVLHEFEDDTAGEIIAKIKHVYPEASVLLTELSRRSSSEIRKARRTVLPELKFVHQLSRQVLRTSAEWKELFGRSGYRAVMERTNDVTCQVCLLFQQGQAQRR